MAIPPVRVPITADTSGLDRGLDTAQGRLRSFASSLLTPVGAAKALGTAVAAAGTALTALTVASLSNIDNMTKQARSLGLTTAALQRMSLVANEAGVETGQLSSMLGLMQRNIVELERGTARQVDTFEAMGLSISDLQGLSPDAQFARIADALNNMEDPAQRTAAAMDVFGRSGRAAINMLGDYADRVDDAAEFQERFGIAVNQMDAEQIERSNDAMGRLRSIFTGLGNVLAAEVAPLIEGFANTLIFLADKILPDFRGEIGTVERSQYALNDAIQAFTDLQTPEALQSITDRAYALRQLADANLEAARAQLAAAQAELATREEAGMLGPDDALILGEKEAAANRMIAESLRQIAEAEAAIRESREGGGAFTLPGTTFGIVPGDTPDPPRTALSRALDEEKERMDQAVVDEEAFWKASAALANSGSGAIFNTLKKINAANALMDAWGAFNKVLNDPAYIGRPWARFAGAAQALSAGLGAVNAIRSVTSSGGGGAGGAGAAVASAAPMRTSSNVALQLVGGDMFSRDQVIGLINAINEAQEDGAVVRMV
jgi:hypothetical protein